MLIAIVDFCIVITKNKAGFSQSGCKSIEKRCRFLVD